MQTQGGTQQPIKGTKHTPEEVAQLNKQRSQQRSQEVNQAITAQQNSWSFSAQP